MAVGFDSITILAVAVFGCSLFGRPPSRAIMVTVARKPDSGRRYQFNGRDLALVSAAHTLLSKIATSTAIRPAELVSLAKLLHVFSRLPLVTPGLEVTLSLAGPSRQFGDIETRHHWDVSIEGDRLDVSSGGYFSRPSTGGDTFTTMSWSATPDAPCELCDYRRTLTIVPDVQSFPEAVAALEMNSGHYELDVIDDSNVLLDDLGAASLDSAQERVLQVLNRCGPEEVESVREGGTDDFGQKDDAADEVPEDQHETSDRWTVITGDAFEQRLAATIVADEVNQNVAQYAYNVEDCGACGCQLEQRVLFVDGCFRGQSMWGNMCAQCFAEKGAGIGWGRGQLYARQADGTWRMLAGFRTN